VSDDRVKDFVRNKLGCDCAEDVFDHIENDRDFDAGGVLLRNRINIGNRLLVYVAEGDAVTGRIPALLKAGKSDRDAGGFNRFRLVVVTDDKKLKKTAMDAFKAMPGLDEKVHLHVMEKSEARNL
jgi:hypothetical protein